MKQYYELGNILRGFVGGYFENSEQALNELSIDFDKRFPSEHGRQVNFSLKIDLGKFFTAGDNDITRVYSGE
jgi:hypothetical protein